MPMSTKIDDLPVPDFKLKPESSVKKSVRFENEPQNDHTGAEVQKGAFKEDQTKHTTGKIGFVTELINEENLLLIGVLYLATLSLIDTFLGKIPGISLSGVWLTLTKCILLMILYVAAKRFILPKIKL